jgi:hypothetical protein
MRRALQRRVRPHLPRGLTRRGRLASQVSDAEPDLPAVIDAGIQRLVIQQHRRLRFEEHPGASLIEHLIVFGGCWRQRQARRVRIDGPAAGPAGRRSGGATSSADGSPSRMRQAQVVSPRKKAVHLYASHALIADRWTDRHRPSEYYVVDGDVYDVSSFEAILEADGSDAFDVQVVARR